MDFNFKGLLAGWFISFAKGGFSRDLLGWVCTYICYCWLVIAEEIGNLPKELS